MTAEIMKLILLKNTVVRSPPQTSFCFKSVKKSHLPAWLTVAFIALGTAPVHAASNHIVVNNLKVSHIMVKMDSYTQNPLFPLGKTLNVNCTASKILLKKICLLDSPFVREHRCFVT